MRVAQILCNLTLRLSLGLILQANSVLDVQLYLLLPLQQLNHLNVCHHLELGIMSSKAARDAMEAAVSAAMTADVEEESKNVKPVAAQAHADPHEGIPQPCVVCSRVTLEKLPCPCPEGVRLCSACMLQIFQKQSNTIKCPACNWTANKETLQQYVMSPAMQDTWFAIPNGVDPEYNDFPPHDNSFVTFVHTFPDTQPVSGAQWPAELQGAYDLVTDLGILVTLHVQKDGILTVETYEMRLDASASWRDFLWFMNINYGVMEIVTLQNMSGIALVSQSMLISLPQPMQVVATLYSDEDGAEWIREQMIGDREFAGMRTYIVTLPGFQMGFMGYTRAAFVEKTLHETFGTGWRMMHNGVAVTDSECIGNAHGAMLYEFEPFVIEAV